MQKTKKQEEQVGIEREKTVDTSNLPKKDLFRIDEVATYFNVAESTIRLWIDHGKLGTERLTRGTIRIPRQAIINFRLKKALNTMII